MLSPMKSATAHRALATLLLCSSLVLPGTRAGAAEPKGPPVTTIELKTFMFSPSSVTIPVGATVVWKNLDAEPHTVASVDGKFRSGALDENDTFTFAFLAPGTYRYVCSIHPQMVGTVIVQPAAP
jgi:plastocyanin